MPGRTREHYNLYYIFLTDKKAHPPPPEAFEEAKEKIAQYIAKIKK